MSKIFRNFLLFLILFSFSCRAFSNTITPPTPIHQPPQTTQQPENDISPTAAISESPSLTELSEKEQLEVYNELWQVVNQNYLYEDFNGLDWDQSFIDTEKLIMDGLKTDAFYELMYQVIYSLGDEHSVFITPLEVEEEELEYSGSSNYAGIGVWITSEPERDLATILLVFANGPAEKAGLKAHDSILSVEGYPVLDMDDNITNRMLGLPGTTVTITVQTPGEEPRELQLVREKILAAFPVPYQVITSPEDQKIGYIFIPTFSEESIDDQVALALNEMGKLDGIIIDNRYNGGGFDNVTNDTLRYFTKGRLGHFVNRFEEQLLRILPLNVNRSQQTPLVVLVGEGTASFGEIFSGILQDNHRAYLIGETTDGNVETLWGYNFSDGSRAWIAHDVFKPLNNPEVDWEKNGIIPDLQVHSDWDLVTLETDPVIVSALDYFDTNK